MREAEAAWGPRAGLAVAGLRAPGRWLVCELGWRPRGPGLVEVVARASYAQA